MFLTVGDESPSSPLQDGKILVEYHYLFNILFRLTIGLCNFSGLGRAGIGNASWTWNWRRRDTDPKYLSWKSDDQEMSGVVLARGPVLRCDETWKQKYLKQVQTQPTCGVWIDRPIIGLGGAPDYRRGKNVIPTRVIRKHGCEFKLYRMLAGERVDYNRSVSITDATNVHSLYKPCVQTKSWPFV